MSDIFTMSQSSPIFHLCILRNCHWVLLNDTINLSCLKLSHCVFLMIHSSGKAFHWAFYLAYLMFPSKHHFSWTFLQNSLYWILLSYLEFHITLSSLVLYSWSIFTSFLSYLILFIFVLFNYLSGNFPKSFLFGAIALEFIILGGDILTCFISCYFCFCTWSCAFKVSLLVEFFFVLSFLFFKLTPSFFLQCSYYNAKEKTKP